MKGGYNQKIKFTGLFMGTGEVIQFPDFTLQYIGTSKIPGPRGAKWHMTTLNFKLIDKTSEQEISWSAGTGVLGPGSFVANDTLFLFEPVYSRGFNLNHELTVTPVRKAVSRAKALEIARRETATSYKDMAGDDILLSLGGDGWLVYYKVRNSPSRGIGPHFVIDFDGKIKR